MAQALLSHRQGFSAQRSPRPLRTRSIVLAMAPSPDTIAGARQKITEVIAKTHCK